MCDVTYIIMKCKICQSKNEIKIEKNKVVCSHCGALLSSYKEDNRNYYRQNGYTNKYGKMKDGDY